METVKGTGKVIHGDEPMGEFAYEIYIQHSEIAPGIPGRSDVSGRLLNLDFATAFRLDGLQLTLVLENRREASIALEDADGAIHVLQWPG